MRRGFTLLECIVALALFAVASVMVAQTVFNCMYAIDLMKKDAPTDAMREYIRMKALEIDDKDSIEDGVDIEDFDGGRIELRGKVYETEILDLFLLEYRATAGGVDFSDRMLVIRKNWYESESDREELLNDRVDALEKLRGRFSL